MYGNRNTCSVSLRTTLRFRLRLRATNRNLTEKCSARIFPKSPSATSLNSDVKYNKISISFFSFGEFRATHIYTHSVRYFISKRGSSLIKGGVPSPNGHLHSQLRCSKIYIFLEGGEKTKKLC